MSKNYNYIVFIGRCSPPHKAHINIISRALEQGENVIMLLGSANQPRTIKNPWAWKEREQMIRDCFPESTQERLVFFGVDDAPNDQQWVRSIQNQIDYVVRADRMLSKEDDISDAKIAIIGHEKDDSSYYLQMFPQWETINVENIDDMNSTDIRTTMFSARINERLKGFRKEVIPEGIANYLDAFMHSDAFDLLKEEWDHIQMYREAWKAAPYAPTFVTVDAVVVQSGHVLMIRRRASPGKGLWAIPGGFLDQKETIEDGALRELREETKLKVPTPVLKGSIKEVSVFDKPDRSLRGRTITHAHYIELPPGPLPKVKGSDDAEKAKWIPLNVFEKMQDQIFEDHYRIVNSFIGDA